MKIVIQNRLIRVGIIAFSLALFTLISWRYSKSYDEQEIEWYTEDIHLKGTLLIPKSELNCIVILIHGSGNVDRDIKSYKQHAQKLVEMGVAVRYYDKRGVGESKGD